MKKILILFLCLSFLFILTSCDYNKPLRERMLKYYGCDDNYVKLTGEIKSLKHYEESDALYLEISIIDGEDKVDTDFYTGYATFSFENWSKYQCELAVGDVITFTSAPDYFYDGHTKPIIHLEKDNQVLLSFEEGKNNYLEWIKVTFEEYPLFNMILNWFKSKD